MKAALILVGLALILISSVGANNACRCHNDCVRDIQYWEFHNSAAGGDPWPDGLETSTFPCGANFLEVVTRHVASCDQSPWLALAREWIAFAVNLASYECIRSFPPPIERLNIEALELLGHATCDIAPEDVGRAYRAAGRLALYNDGLYQNGPRPCNNQCPICNNNNPPCSCTHTQGWYRDHYEEWSDFTIARPFCDLDTTAEWHDILATDPAGNNWYALAHQYITAYLNVNFLHSCVNAAVAPEVEEAIRSLLESGCVTHDIPDEPARTLYAILRAYNAGNLCTNDNGGVG
jgi:hypothetical protein